ncbi:hypothetical protein WJX72_006214 [[Myrmecia] bisecta]|uniref:F-box domain-containing protein n=1 Tax=[Myrmecia] bisecta TaxID=41462 RepID=A0AAW1P7K6_9CHLO
MGRSKPAKAPARKKGRSSVAPVEAGPALTIDGLPDSLLAHVFQRVAVPKADACSDPSRSTLPLVCKRWRDILKLPSCVWEETELNLCTRFSHQCILRSKVEAWLWPRRASVQRLVIRGASHKEDWQHTFLRTGHGLGRLLGVTEVPLGVTALSNLRELDLSGCHLDSEGPPQGLVALLTTLRLDSIDTESWDADAWEFLANATLSTLSLRDCQMHMVPFAVGYSTASLSTLDLSNNMLDPVSDAEVLGHLAGLADSLQSLSLNSCSLSYIPDVVCDLSHLTSLSLSSNSLVQLPEGYSQLTALQQLDISNNTFPTLPEALTSLASLTAVDLSRNLYLELPTWSSLASLTSLMRLERINLTKAAPYQSYSCKHIRSLTMLLEGVCSIECKEAVAG